MSINLEVLYLLVNKTFIIVKGIAVAATPVLLLGKAHGPRSLVG